MPINNTPIETLKKITYQDLNQFIEDINRNFAVVENSPLYKGIPGNEGVDGNTGTSGIRGIKFIFVNLQNFQTNFPNELTATNQIDINYINTKLLTFINKQKLFLSLNITELVDKDIIVLSNTIMLSYDTLNNLFINTGIAFNQQTNLLSNIQQQIQDYVQYYVSINQTINNLTNTFESYVTYAKNYNDTNNTFITSSLLDSSVYSPYIPGFNNNIGILINNHKYFGYSDLLFSEDNNGSIVFGSMKKYYNLLMQTLSTNTNNTLTSDYAPGVGNIPSAVFLQDTENSGILIGYKDKPNLKKFANIFKNNINELILKSDSGINPSEFSLLKLHKDYLKFNKLVQFENDLEVSRDVKFFADINNAFLRTGKFTSRALLQNQFNKNIVEIGKERIIVVSDDENIEIIEEPETVIKHVSDLVMYKHYVEKVLITDNNGFVSKDYTLEKQILLNNPLIGLNLINTSINSPTKILTSYYYGYLALKINAITDFCALNYWRKNQFNNGDIPALWISDTLKVEGNINLSEFIKTNLAELLTEIISLNLKIDSKNIVFNEFKNNVLVNDNTGKLLDTYFIDNELPNSGELTGGQDINEIKADFWVKEPENNTVLPWQPFLNVTSSSLRLLTGKHFNHLIKQITIIRELLFNRPTYTETIEMVGNGLPIGSIILWDNKINSLIPPNKLINGLPIGFVVCDGRYIPGTTIRTSNMTDKFVKGSLSPGTIGGNIDSKYKLIATDMFPHTHSIDTHGYGDIYHSEEGGNISVPSNIGSGDTDTNNGGFQILRTTAQNTTGLSTNTFPTVQQTEFSIEPYSITAIYLLKYWNGIGVPPVTIMPPFANIITIVNDKLEIIVNFTLIDTTVTNINVEGSIDNGLNWNTLSIFTNNTSPKVLNLPYSNDWVFRLKAINGDSAFTVGQYSNLFNKSVYTEFAEITGITGITNNLLTTKISFTKFDNSVSNSSISVFASNNGGTYTEYIPTFSQINKLQVILPAYGNWNFKLFANNGTPITTTSLIDNNSNIFNYEVAEVVVPEFFTDLYSVSFIEVNLGPLGPDGENLFRSDIIIESSGNPNVTNVIIQYADPNNIGTWISVNTVPYYSTINYNNFFSIIPGVYAFRLKVVGGVENDNLSDEVMSTY